MAPTDTLMTLDQDRLPGCQLLDLNDSCGRRLKQNKGKTPLPDNKHEEQLTCRTK
jgi:hypothetical protein